LFAASKKDFLLQDLQWYSALDDTKWLQGVGLCLNTALEAVEIMVDKRHSVILKGTPMLHTLDLPYNIKKYSYCFFVIYF
jgi:hypothetical protein